MVSQILFFTKKQPVFKLAVKLQLKTKLHLRPAARVAHQEAPPTTV